MKLKIKNLIEKISFYEIINILFIASSVILIVISDYKILDGFWTPLRGIYFLSDISNYNGLFFENLADNVVHNDSIKFIPTLIEFIPSVLIRYWAPRLSLLIGISSWIICYVVFRELIINIFEIKDKNKDYLSLFLSICFFSSLPFFSVFTILFAIHKTIPLICSVGIFLIIFQKSRSYILQNQDFFKIILLSLIALFSFASGVFLFPITALAIMWKSYLLPNGKIRKFLYYYLFIAVIFLVIYFGLYNYDHIIDVTIKNYENKNLLTSSSILLFISFIFTYCSSFFAGFDFVGSKYFIALSYLQFAFYGSCILFFSRSFEVIVSKENIFKVSPLFFIIFFNSIGLLLVLITRGSNNGLYRGYYFCESCILSLSLLAIFIFYILQINKDLHIFRILSMLFLVLFMSNIIGYLLFVKNYVLMPQYREYVGDRLLIKCIKNIKNPSYYSLKNECDLGKNFGHFKEDRLLEHSSIRIKDVDDYSRKVFKVFGNKNQYKSIK